MFLGPENILRIVSLKAKHPEKMISLIYSSGILSDQENQSLLDFCSKNDITAIDFDMDVFEWVQNSKHELDLILYKLAA